MVKGQTLGLGPSICLGRDAPPNDDDDATAATFFRSCVAEALSLGVFLGYVVCNYVGVQLFLFVFFFRLVYRVMKDVQTARD